MTQSKIQILLSIFFFCFLLFSNFASSTVSAKLQFDQENTTGSFAIIDGKIVALPHNDKNQHGGDSRSLDGVEAELSMLELVAASDEHRSITYRTAEGIEIQREDILGGFILINPRNDLTNQLSNSFPFSNVLELSPEQTTEIKKIRTELFEELRTKAKSLTDVKEFNQLVKETNAEFTRRLKMVLLPFQHSALIKYSVDSVGLLPAVSRVSQGEFLEKKIDEKKLERIATEQLNKIESTISQLKKELAQEIIILLSVNDREMIEKALERNLEEIFVNASLDDLQKQLEFVKDGGIPKLSTLREFAEKLSQDSSPNSQRPK
jgi:hypothetical protein